jgi:hypothetical protein
MFGKRLAHKVVEIALAGCVTDAIRGGGATAGSGAVKVGHGESSGVYRRGGRKTAVSSKVTGTA